MKPNRPAPPPFLVCTATLIMAGASLSAQQPPVPKPDSAARPAAARPAAALPTVQVTASPVATDARRVAQPTSSLAGAALRRANGASLGETLEQIPGVRSLSMTTGIGKPVIRGLTNNRVVTLANGQRTETQQWGHDHSPNVESADAERIEVVKGPASVLYGSDALGGVVNVVRRALPRADPTTSIARGRVALAFNSAAVAPSATLVGEGARGAFGWRASGTGRRADDLRTPGGVLANSGNVTGYGELGVGWRDDRRDVALTTSVRDERIQIADDPVTAPGYSGRQRIQTQRASLDANTRVQGQRLQLLAGWEQNRRSEYGSAQTSVIDLGLQSTTMNGLTHWHHAPVLGFTGIVGVAAQRTVFRTYGTETLIPDNQASSLGLYAFEQRVVGPWAVSAGARHDWRWLDTPGNQVLGLAPSRNRFGAVTGTLGAVYHSEKPLALAINVARGFRAPSASDLWANGFHEGTRAFEIGKSDLRVESSLNTDVGLRVRHARVSGELTGYVNRIQNYIYLVPVGAPGRALDSLQVQQGHAQLAGVELSASLPLPRSFTFQTVADVVRARNTTDNSALPFVPPMRLATTLRWDERAPGRYASVSVEYNARQTRTFRNDFSPRAWSMLSAAVGKGLMTRRGIVFVDVNVRNVLNTRYRDFMSRYKEFANAAGRAVSIKLSADI